MTDQQTKITMEKCTCGDKNCSTWWLSIGRFCQGAGFSEAEATLICTALNDHAELVEALRSVLDLADDWKIRGGRIDKARALLAHLDATGCQIVPKVATEEMVQASSAAMKHYIERLSAEQKAKLRQDKFGYAVPAAVKYGTRYVAMLAAAPKWGG